jgi:hypothetical protein
MELSPTPVAVLRSARLSSFKIMLWAFDEELVSLLRQSGEDIWLATWYPEGIGESLQTISAASGFLITTSNLSPHLADDL